MPTIEILYDVNDAELRNRFLQEIIPKSIDNLEKDTKPDFGRMSSQQMLEHLILSFKMSYRDLGIKCITPKNKRAEVQAFLNTNVPIHRGRTNPVTGDKLLELKFPNLELAKDKLKEEIKNFLNYYKKNPVATQINPVFGELNSEQWQRFYFKHCFHHLSQFRLITPKAKE